MPNLSNIVKTTVLCLFIAPTALSFNTNIARAQTRNTVPQSYSGVWRGNGVQKNPSSEWSILIAITGGNVNSIVGTVAYPSLNCGGELRLRRVSTNSIELSESITYGACINNGIMTLKASSTRALEYGWQQGATTAIGKVQKISGK
ncbi:hypothetical protein CAL7716_018150 [Calothrix sp. PCC 7716]|nr:hypothetical protein CAL7716_018150 [Calothrix sp. PCC 7716]